MRKPGERAPNFALTPLDGGPQRDLLSLIAHGPVLLAFFKVTCPTCQYTFPFLERFREHNVVAISQDDASLTREFHDAFGITLPTLLDSARDGYPASNAYALTHVPSLFLIDRAGVIRYSGSGFSRADLELLGQEFGVEAFGADEVTPVFRPG